MHTAVALYDKQLQMSRGGSRLIERGGGQNEIEVLYIGLFGKVRPKKKVTAS